MVLVGVAPVGGSDAIARATEVWVITDRAHPVTGQTDRHILLDGVTQLESELATGLPSEADTAAGIVQQRLSDGGTGLQRRFAATYQGVTDAWSLGITKIPAVVVDRRFVVYGEANVAHAVARIEQHQRELP